jgi:hypothetical protein
MELKAVLEGLWRGILGDYGSTDNAYGPFSKLLGGSGKEGQAAGKVAVRGQAHRGKAFHMQFLS